MKIVVFGGSGLTGQQVLAEALERGHAVTAFARTPSKLDGLQSRVRVVAGNVADPAAVRAAVKGQDAVISTLGVGKPLAHDQAVIDGVGHILRAMRDEGVKRVLYLSFAGVKELTGFAVVLRPLIGFVLRHEIADHAEKEALVRASDRDWTVIHAPKLKNGAGTGRYRYGPSIEAHSAFPSAFPLLDRVDLAAGISKVLEDPTTVRQTIRILP
jgi:putative NADH-flavin reductase